MIELPPSLRTQIQTRQSKKADGGGNEAADLDEWLKSRMLVKPDDQLDLTEAELAEEINKVLTTTNTNVIRNLVVFSFKEGEFVLAPMPGNTVQLLSFAGNSLHVESDAARYQIEESEEIGYPLPMPNYAVVEQRETLADGEEEGEGEDDERDEMAAGKGSAHAGEGEGEEGEEEEDEEGKATEGGTETEQADDGGVVMPTSNKKRKLINQFNYCERATLTYTNPKRVS